MNELLEDLIDNARELRSQDGENPEYDRALVELISQTFGLPYPDMPELITYLVLGR